MAELYWINVIGNLHIIFCVMAVLFGVALFFISYAYINDAFETEYVENAKWWIKKFIFAFLIDVLLLTLVPSKKDLYIIYGVGTTINYLQENTTVNKLPDKVVNALDEMIDNYIKDKDENH